MAEEKKPEGEEAQEAPAPKSSKKLIIIGCSVAVLLLAVGIPVLFLSKKADAPEKSEELNSEAALHAGDLQPEGFDDEEELVEGEEPLGAIYPLETFIVNLSGGKYIRLQAQLEFVERQVPFRFYNRMVPIRDRLIMLLSSKTAEELAGTKDKEDLKNEIKNTVNEVLRKEEIKTVYFSQFIIQ